MKKILTIFLLTTSLNIYAKEIPIPNLDYFISKTLKFHFIIGGATIHFFKNNKYQISYGSEGWDWYNEGNYEYKNGKIYLHSLKCLSDKNGSIIDCNQTMGNAICTLYENEDSLHYSQYLEVKSLGSRSVFTSDPKGGSNYIEFDVLESKVTEGMKRKINNIPVIIMGQKNGIAIDNVKIRKMPSIESESIKYQKGIFGLEATEMDFVPINTDLIIIARTTEKQKVKEWNNYWYYINVGTKEGVWIFGEFIKIK